MNMQRGLSILTKEGGSIQASAVANASASLTLSSAERDSAVLRAKPSAADTSKTDLELIGGGGLALITSGSTNQQTGQLNQDITISNSGVVTFQQTPKVLTQNIATEQHAANNFLPKNGPANFFGTLTLTDPPVSDDPASANNHLMRKQETDAALDDKVNIAGTVRLTGSKTFASPVISEVSASNANELIRKGEVDSLLLDKVSNSLFTGNVSYSGNQSHSGFMTMSGGANFTNGVPSCAAAPTGSSDLTNKAYVDSNSSLTGNEAQKNAVNTFTSGNTFSGGVTLTNGTTLNMASSSSIIANGNSLVQINCDSTSNFTGNMNQARLRVFKSGTTNGPAFITGMDVNAYTDIPANRLGGWSDCTRNGEHAGIKLLYRQDGQHCKVHYYNMTRALTIQNHMTVNARANDSNDSFVTFRFTVNSDDRLKSNEEPVLNATARLGELNFVEYNRMSHKIPADFSYELNESGKPMNENGDVIECTREIGVIAQQMKQTNLSNFVEVTNDTGTGSLEIEDLHSVDYHAIWNLGMAAILEQAALSAKERDRLLALEQEVSTLTQRIEALESK
jgi:hypothetical protein